MDKNQLPACASEVSFGPETGAADGPGSPPYDLLDAELDAWLSLPFEMTEAEQPIGLQFPDPAFSTLTAAQKAAFELLIEEWMESLFARKHGEH